MVALPKKELLKHPPNDPSIKLHKSVHYPYFGVHPQQVPSITSRMPPMKKGCLSSSYSVPSNIWLVPTEIGTSTTGLGSMSVRPSPIAPVEFLSS